MRASRSSQDAWVLIIPIIIIASAFVQDPARRLMLDGVMIACVVIVATSVADTIRRRWQARRRESDSVGPRH